MNGKKVYLQAQWKHLVLANYAVPDSVLEPYLPDNCELDKYEGSAYLSLVAFQFKETKVYGLKWPGYTNFPEYNLRFYIKLNGVRGVCFIREYVPSKLIAWIARSVYNEPYKAANLQDIVESNAETIAAQYSLNDQGATFNVVVKGNNSPYEPPSDSIEHFFKEHELGVGRSKSGETVTYNVHHPIWRVYPIQEYALSIDWERVYGQQFSFLQGREPNSLCFAEGSEITVFKQN